MLPLPALRWLSPHQPGAVAGPLPHRWIRVNVIAHNLARWVTRLGLKETLLTTKTVRTRFIALPGRLARTGRRLHLHLPQNWPWQDAFLAARERLASLIIPTATPA